MENCKVLIIGGSRNIGYHAAIRLLTLGATITFLLRSPRVFDQDGTVQSYVKSGKARLIQGDALVKDDVRQAWSEAEKGDDNRPVDFLLFTLGGKPHFSFTKGFIVSPPNLVTQSFLNVLETLPSVHPKIITISSTGITRNSHKALPLPLKLFYGYFLSVPHKDKSGAEEVIAHCVGRSWDAQDSAGEEILGTDWANRVPLGHGQLQGIVVVRPAMLTNGECRGDIEGSMAYRVKEGDMESSWTVSRRDVAHFLVEGVAKHWQDWEGKCVSIAY